MAGCPWDAGPWCASAYPMGAVGDQAWWGWGTASWWGAGGSWDSTSSWGCMPAYSTYLVGEQGTGCLPTPMPSQTQSRRTLKVAMYFGTFDPIHENHVGIAKFALAHGYADLVYFIVNGDNPMKPGATVWSSRQRLVQQRLDAEGQERLHCLDLSQKELSDMGWSGRARLCARIRAEAGASFPGHAVEMLQIMGQDAFEHAVERSSGTARQAGIFCARWRFLVFPRGGDRAAARTRVPKELQGAVTVVEEYADPVLISSTAIREALVKHDQKGGRESDTVCTTVHPQLRSEVMSLYAARGCLQDDQSFFVIFIGGPGSGKTTLGHALLELGFRHVSGGALFRAVTARASRGGHWNCEGQLQAKIFGATASAIAALPAPRLVSFDGFLPKDLRDFEEKVGPVALILEVQCGETEMLRRISARGSRDNDVALDAEERVKKYQSAKQQSINADMLKSFDGGRGLVRRLNTEQDFEDVRADLFGIVHQAAMTRGLEIRASGSMDGSSTVWDETFWKAELQKLESSPQQSYNARKNAATLQDRVGSRALKNFNNLIKTVLIDASLAEVAAALACGDTWPMRNCIEVFDVASGRGGDQLKFARSASDLKLRLCYTGMDVAEEQVVDAVRRLRAARDKAAFVRARFFIGDVARVAPQDLPWQQVVSIQFALQYAFGSEADARSFLRNSLSRLCSGGMVIAVTLDAASVASVAKAARRCSDGNYVVENSLYRVTFADEESAQMAAAAEARFGLRYHFALSGEGIGCDEYVVPEGLLKQLFSELDVHDVASVPFSQLLGAVGHAPSAAALAAALLSQLPAKAGTSACLEALAGAARPARGRGRDSGDGVSAGDGYAMYDRLGLALSAEEAEVVGLYKAYVGRRGAGRHRRRPGLAAAVRQCTESADAGKGRYGGVLAGGEPVRLTPPAGPA